MSVLVLAFTTVNPDAPEALSAYMATTSILLEEAGAEILHRYEISDAVIGTPPGKYATLLRYPSREAVDWLFSHSEYQLLRNVREQAFLEYQVNIVTDFSAE